MGVMQDMKVGSFVSARYASSMRPGSSLKLRNKT